MKTSITTHPPRVLAVKGPRIHRERRPGLDMTIVERGKLREFHLTLRPLPGEAVQIMLWRLEGQLREHNALVVKQDVFGALSARDEFLARMRRLFREIFWPITWVEGTAGEPGAVAGVQVLAVAGVEIELVRLQGRIVGRIFDDGVARHCLLGDICPTDISADNSVQARQVYENMESALVEHGMGLANIVRTWLYLDNILGWYGPFNHVRTEIFTQRNLFTTGVPASTGIGAKNPYGAALVAGAWAVAPLDRRMQIFEVPSPLQCAASGYGSCFSRAMELSTPTHRRLLVSGTASIGQHGRSLREGDRAGQINLTMEVIKAILNSRNMGLRDVTRAVAYFKHIADAPLLTLWSCENQVSLPAIVTGADICREELLFEMELDAIVETNRRPVAVAASREPKGVSMQLAEAKA